MLFGKKKELSDKDLKKLESKCTDIKEDILNRDVVSVSELRNRINQEFNEAEFEYLAMNFLIKIAIEDEVVKDEDTELEGKDSQMYA